MKCIILSILACVTFSRVAFAATLVRDGSNGTNCVGASETVQELNNILKISNSAILEQAGVLVKLINYQDLQQLPEVPGFFKSVSKAFSQQVNTTLNLLLSTGAPRDVSEGIRKLSSISSALYQLAGALVNLMENSQYTPAHIGVTSKPTAGVDTLIPKLNPIITVAIKALREQADSSANLLISHASGEAASIVPKISYMLRLGNEALFELASSVGELMSLQTTAGAGSILYDLNKILAIATNALHQQAITLVDLLKSRG